MSSLQERDFEAKLGTYAVWVRHGGRIFSRKNSFTIFYQFIYFIAMEQLKNFNLHNLFRQLQLSDEDFEEWLKTLKLLPRRKICECGQDMNFKWKKFFTVILLWNRFIVISNE